jgi:hypothetical protein
LKTNHLATLNAKKSFSCINSLYKEVGYENEATALKIVFNGNLSKMQFWKKTENELASPQICLSEGTARGRCRKDSK